MKTTKEWFDELSAEERELAIQNTDEDILNTEARGVCDALNGAFVWCLSPQGQAYWMAVEQKHSEE